MGKKLSQFVKRFEIGEIITPAQCSQAGPFNILDGRVITTKDFGERVVFNIDQGGEAWSLFLSPTEERIQLVNALVHGSGTIGPVELLQMWNEEHTRYWWKLQDVGEYDPGDGDGEDEPPF